MFANYEFYATQYGGKLTEEEFTVYENRASYYIDSLTLNRASKYLEATDKDISEDRTLSKLAMASSAVTDVIAKYEKALDSSDPSGASSAMSNSETVGAHTITRTVSYRNGSEVEKALREQISGMLGVYLAGTGLLYRGIPVCIHRML